MHMMDMNIMQIFGKAVEAAQRGDKLMAMELSDKYAQESFISLFSADPNGVALIVAPLGNLYAKLEEWELVVLKSKDVCALAEKYLPNTNETAGDYALLSQAYEKLNDFKNAYEATLCGVRHTKGAGTWDSYSGYYEKKLNFLKNKIDTP